MNIDADALVIGAGPAGSAAAILLAGAGWRVILVEQHTYPRQKVCGECISAGGLTLLDELGIGIALDERAGPELRRVGWMGTGPGMTAAFPACTGGAHSYGRALGRDVLDTLLLERARALGVEIMQPAKVNSVAGTPGQFTCGIKMLVSDQVQPRSAWATRSKRVRVVIDAHGSWEPGPAYSVMDGYSARARAPMRSSDLFAFKARYAQSGVAPELLPVLAFRGGYGGVVVAENGRTTLACCIRRDTLQACRQRAPGVPAGEAVAEYLRRCCSGLATLIEPLNREGAWLSVGPIRPGIRVDLRSDVFRVGNAAGETHPLVGEGITMALQSAFLLAGCLTRSSARTTDPHAFQAIHRQYAAAWRAAFRSRLRCARLYAHVAMRPAITVPVYAVLRRCPPLLTRAARWAGKAQQSALHT